MLFSQFTAAMTFEQDTFPFLTYVVIIAYGGLLLNQVRLLGAEKN
jgi:hypothetical protein